MRLWDELVVDGRSAFRALRARTGLAAVSVLILAIGLGASSAVIRLMRGLLLDPLPAVEHEALFALGRNTLSHPDYLDLRSAATDIADVAAYVNVRLGMADNDGERLVRGALVSDNYFEVLGIKPLLGRFFDAADEKSPVAVIANSLRRSHFPRETQVIGSEIRLGAETLTVVGVAPPGFGGIDLEYPTAVWVPLGLQPLVQPGQARFNLLNRRSVRWLGGIARASQGIDLNPAQAWIDSWTARMAESFPRGRAGWSIALTPLAQAVISPQPRVTVIKLLRVVGIVALLILLITSVNLSILFLLGLVSRNEELAVRLAHGASRARIARQLALEMFLLAAAGAAGGLLVGGWLARLGQRLVLPPQIAPQVLSLDGWSFAATLAAAVISCSLASLPLLRQLRQVEIFHVIRRASAGLTGLGPAGRNRFALISGRSGLALLVAGQTALSLPLLHGVLLVGSSLMAQKRIDLGFTVNGVTLAKVTPSVTQLGRSEGLLLYQSLLEALKAASGVEAVGLAALAPIGDNRLLWEVILSPGEDPQEIAGNVVSPGYFASMGVPLLRGRDFDFEVDGPGREPVVLINESLASRLWPGRQAVGRELALMSFDGPEPHRVIGVVRDMRHGDMQAAPEPFLYRPLAQDYQSHVTLHARTSLPPSALTQLIRESLQRLNPRVPVDQVRTLADDVDSALARAYYLTLGMGLLGAVAALLAAVGLYGVLAFAARRRAREIGIRMSLGARPGTIHGQVLARGLRLALAGMVPGTVLALIFGHFLSARLYGLSAFEGYALVIAACLLTAVALLASELPAFRAKTVDPAEILRQT